jgi:hypothetical protein
MRKYYWLSHFLLVASLLATAGCEHIALIPRESVATGPRPDRVDGSRSDRVDGSRSGFDRLDLVGTVETNDTRAREITIRTTDGQTRRVAYNPDTRAFIRGRESPISEVRRGDVVEVQTVRDSRGGEYVNVVRVRESDRASLEKGRLPGTDRSPLGKPGERIGQVQTIEGTVERVDIDRGYFEVNPRFGNTTRVYLPYNPARGTVDQFRRLREGDYVRIEGELVSDNRVELKAFRDGIY